MPDDASVGLLPPKHEDFGEGFVEFQIDLARTSTHLTELFADASIIFDNNEPIETNRLKYTIDSVAPVLKVTRIDDQELVLVEASDSGSGVRLVSIYDGDELLFESSEAEFGLVLEPREKPYEIYGSVQDNVGNVSPAQFYLSVLVTPENIRPCPNNCSNNGVCNQFSACVCFDMFTGEDCGSNLTLADVLSEPVDYRFGYKTSDLRDRFIFEIELDTSFDEAVVEVHGFPPQVEIMIGNSRDSLMYTFSSNESSRVEFEAKVPRDYDVEFVLELIISAERSYENETVQANHSHNIPVWLHSFFPVKTVRILNESSVCYKGEDVNIQFEIDELDSQDEIDMEKTSFSNTFLSVADFVRLSDQRFEVTLESIEKDFEPVDIWFVFDIKFTSFDDRVLLDRHFRLEMCRENTFQTYEPITNEDTLTTQESTRPTKAMVTKKPGLSTGALIGIIVGSVLVLLIIVAILICCYCKSKNSTTLNQFEMH